MELLIHAHPGVNINTSYKVRKMHSLSPPQALSEGSLTPLLGVAV